ncbi:MAG TPA: hypothetical protein VMV57_11755 [Terracidiphilus sp.]|nr:hypothetical protein [Terracidiphilus sp.]
MERIEVTPSAFVAVKGRDGAILARRTWPPYRILYWLVEQNYTNWKRRPDRSTITDRFVQTTIPADV